MSQTKTLHLLALTALVAVAHLAVLGSDPNTLLSPSSTPPISMDTRMLSTAPPAPSRHTAPTRIATPTPPITRNTPASGQPADPAPQTNATPHATVNESPTGASIGASPNVSPPSTAHSSSVTHAAATPSSPAANEVKLPPSGTLKYDVRATAKGFDYSANADLVFQQNGQEYEARLTIGAFLMGSRVDSSRGRIGASGLEPERYSQKSRGERAAHFDRTQGKIVFSSNRPEAALLAGAQDRLSVLLQLTALVAAQPERMMPGHSIGLQVASADSAESWVFKIENTETVNLPAGQIPALKLHRIPVKEYGQRVEVWLSPEHAYLPVRLRITSSNGDMSDLLWRN